MGSSELDELLSQDESQKLEFKDSGVLADPFKLAKTMTAFTNSEGGCLLIGVKDDKSIEGLRAKRGHEEHIMNVASDLCDPYLVPTFRQLKVSKEASVYLVEIQERQGPFHAVKTKSGYKFFTRLGSTIREMKPSELNLGDQGVEIQARTGFDVAMTRLGRWIIIKAYGQLDVNIRKLQIGFAALSFLLIAVPLLAVIVKVYEAQNLGGNLGYPLWVYVASSISFASGFFMAIWLSYIQPTMCEKCKSHFSFHPAKKWVFSKRKLKPGVEEWKTRTMKRCQECDHVTFGKLGFEEVPLD